MTFFAVPLDDGLKGSIESILKPWSLLYPNVAWVHPADLHLTLRFLGGLDRDRSLHLASEMRSSSIASFALPLRGCLVFDKGRRGGVLCAAVHPEGHELIALRNEIEAQLQGLGFAGEERLFSPHVTLARFERNQENAIEDFCAAEKTRGWGVIEAAGYQLMKRKNSATREEAQYEVLANFALMNRIFR